MRRKIIEFLTERPKLLFIVAIVYFVCPIDLFPEAIVGPMGYLDDVMFLALGAVVWRYFKKRRSLSVDTTVVQ